jgi:hypothetical protein
MKTGNLGEWSEILVFLKLLLVGKATEAGHDLRPKDRSLRVLELLRDDASGLKVFKTCQENYENNGHTVTRSELEKTSEDFLHLLSSQRGAFDLPQVEDLMHRLGLTKIKASANQKIDLTAVVESRHSSSEITLGYSIKSQLGGSSTLLNASRHTLFRYKVEGKKDSIERLKQKKARELIVGLLEEGSKFSVVGPLSPQLENNLLYFGESLGKILSQLLLSYYSGKGKSIAKLINDLSPDETVQRRNRFQVGQFLRAIALGMTPGKSCEVLALPAANEDDFREYLLENCFFDTPSTSRHDFGKIIQDGNDEFIDLSMQVRFN